MRIQGAGSVGAGPRIRFAWLAISALGSMGCAGGWASLPRQGETDPAPDKQALPLRDYSRADVEAALAATVAFDATRAPREAAQIPIPGTNVSLKRRADGRWGLGADGVAVDLVVQGAVGGLDTIVLVDAPAGRVCHTTLTLAALFRQVERTAEEDSKRREGQAVLDPTWVGRMGKDDDTKTACYDVRTYLPEQPARVAVSFDVSGVEAMWVPTTAQGKPDPRREGVVVWSYFDLYNPNGAGNVARMRVVP